MKNYSTPIIEIQELETEDVILTSPGTGGNMGGGAGGGNETGGYNPWATDIGSIGGSTGGKISIGGGSTGGVSAGDLFGNR